MFRFLGKVLMGILITGLIYAILRAFNFDLFGVFDWFIGWAIDLITRVSDFFSSNPTFQKVVEAPKS